MSSLTLSVLVDRTELSLADLEINDGTTYIVTDRVNPGAVSWRREQVTSPYVDGAVTVSRAKEIVEGQIVVDVLGATQGAVQNSIATLIDAFTQDQFELTFSMDGTIYKWQCEAADYIVNWDRVRFINRKVSVGFQFPRQPVPLTGPY